MLLVFPSRQRSMSIEKLFAYTLVANLITITHSNKHKHKTQNLVVLPFQVSSVVVVLPLYGTKEYSKTPLMTS
jgi:hypothetical protein